MDDYFNQIAVELGVSVWLLVVIVAWSLIWKLLGMWKSARKGSVIWFIILALFNTVGVLPILYIFIFSKIKFSKPVAKTKKKKKITQKK